MNKKRVDSWLLNAKEALIKTEIAKNGAIEKTYRSQISSFGAAVTMGSFKAAVAFFSAQGGASVHREKLLSAMYYVVFKELKTEKQVLDYVCENDTRDLRNQFIDASIALKLAMNFFDLDS